MVSVLSVVRRNRGLNVTTLSTLTSCNQKVLSDVERYQKRPWPALRHKLAEVLDAPEDLLFMGNGWARPISRIIAYEDDQQNVAMGT